MAHWGQTTTHPSLRLPGNLPSRIWPQTYAFRERMSGKNRGPSSSSYGIVHGKEAEPIMIDGRENFYSVAILADGKHIVSGGKQGKIRRWRIEDGMEVGTPMHARSVVCSIAVSRDGTVIVSGTDDGQVIVWDAENHSKATEFNAHDDWVRAVDVSSDATKIATGSDDNTACVWSVSTGERLLDPWEHDCWVVAAKFSPDGRLVATATCDPSHGLDRDWDSDVRVYDSLDGSLLVEFELELDSMWNYSFAWASDSKQLFSLSRDGYIYRFDVSSGTTLSKWLIHSSGIPTCIALASNETFIAVATGSSVSLWDTTSQEQIGTTIKYTHDVTFMAMSSNVDLVTGGDKKITIRALRSVPPFHYLGNISIPCVQEVKVEQVDDSPDEGTASAEQTICELRNQLIASQQTHQEMNNVIQSLRVQEESSNSKIARLEKTVQDLTESQSATNEEKDRLSGTIAHLERTNQELYVQLADAQRGADRMNHAHEQKHQCESLYAQGRIQGAAECLLEFADTVNEHVRASKLIIDWLAEFTQRCVTALERIGDEASNAEKPDEAVIAYSAALSLGPTTPNVVLMKWASIMLIRGSADEASSAATKFKVPKFVVYRVICDILERDSRLTEAVEFFRQMQNEVPEDAGVRDERAEWKLDFRRRCALRLEKLGDILRDSEKHDEAIGHHSNSLSLAPTNNDIPLKRSNEDIEPEPRRMKHRSS